MIVDKEKMLAIVNGITYAVPRGTTLDTLEDYLHFKLEVCDAIQFIDFGHLFYWPGIVGPTKEKETYVSPFTGRVM